MNNNKITPILDTENFSAGNRFYYLDLKKAHSQNHYLRITRYDRLSKERSKLILFEDDLPFFVEALSMLLGRLSHGQIGASA